MSALQALVHEFHAHHNRKSVHQVLDSKTLMEVWQATDPAPYLVPESPLPHMPPSAWLTANRAEAEPQPRSRALLALHPGMGSIDLVVEQNGQVKVLGCWFYGATDRAGQTAHVMWNKTTVEIFAADGRFIISYPRPTKAGLDYGPRTPAGTPMKGTGHNSSARRTGTATRAVSEGGCIVVLPHEFYAGYKRQGEELIVAWHAAVVTLTDAHGMTVAQCARPHYRQGRHGPDRQTTCTNS